MGFKQAGCQGFMMYKYSVYGSDDFHRYIDDVLNQIRKRLFEEISAHQIKALVLGGGYGRSEGGVWLDNGEEKLYNDLDFFVFSARLPYWTRAKLENKLNKLHQELSEIYGLDVDFSPIVAASKLPKTDISLMYYDLKYAHKVIYGNPHIMSNLPEFRAEDIPEIEALRLLLNRGMGLFFAYEYICSQGWADQRDFILRNIHKAYQALAEAILIFEHKYHSSVLVRMNLIEEISFSAYCSNENLKQLILESMKFKLLPHISPFSQSELLQLYQDALSSFRDVYFSLWALYFGSDALSYEQYLQYLKRKRELQASRMIKNLLLNLRDLPLRAIVGKAGLMYPRERLYQALPYFLFGDYAPSLNLKSILGIGDISDSTRNRDRFVSLWQSYN